MRTDSAEVSAIYLKTVGEWINYSGWNVGSGQWRIEGTIFVPKKALLAEGGKKLPIFGAKLVAKTATKQFGIQNG